MKIFVCPEVEIIISKHCAVTKIRKDFTSHYLYVISNIYVRPFVDRSVEDSDYVSINMQLLRTVVSDLKAESIINDLIYLNILETDGKIIRGKKSRGYKIIDKWKLTWKLQDMKDHELAKKLTGKYDDIKDNVNKHGKGYQIVNHWFQLFEIDCKKAKKYISNRYTRDQDMDRYNSAFCSINLFEKEMKFIVVDDTSNRLHCNLTNIDAKLRKFLTIDDQKLAQVDIRNSQPLFLGMLMRGNTMVESAELDRYLELVCSGQFYEYMAKKVSCKHLNLKDALIRKKFKKSIFSGVLFDVNRAKLSKYELLFQEEFPTIFGVIRHMKAVEYNALAIMLQKMESKFIFDAVAKIDYEIGKGRAPLLTIHDSVVSTTENIYMVEQIMEQLFFREYSLKPQLEVTEFK
ncbi:hypothetical protein CLU83_2953 [Flavobacterium sp. 1]|uniref:hypothetical protein n=1 Tax=Flavobacterium sp. 1 TaxID=2035200 RepID=UPI000C23A917|nr:hypothetical protein [Flavobacterium sp. 1]PJJ09589.1 hypothetical protein CLU83_2953 [Flavobacterium sp. 1]